MPSKQELREKLNREDNGIDYNKPIWYHWLILVHYDGTREQHLVCDQQSEDCLVYQERDEILAEIGDEIKSVHIQLASKGK